MPRVKGGVTANKHRRKVLKQAKGYRFGRSTKEREAKVALLHAGVHAYAHRKDKKSDFRGLWQTQISASTTKFDLSYSKFIGLLKKKGIALNRKMLADLASNEPKTFEQIIALAKA